MTGAATATSAIERQPARIVSGSIACIPYTSPSITRVDAHTPARPMRTPWNARRRHYEPDDPGGPGAQRHANAQLPDPARHEVRHRPIHARRRKEERRHREEGDQRCCRSVAARSAVDARGHGAHVGRRRRRIGGEHRRADRTAAVASSAFRETRATAGRRRLRLQGALVSAEIALALILVTGSALLLRSFSALLRADPGFVASDLVVADIRPPGGIDRAGQRQFYGTVLERAETLPGVRHVSLLSTAPGISGGTWVRTSVEGAEPARPDGPFTRLNATMGDAFVTLGIQVRGRRSFDAVTATDPLVVILNQSAAKQFFPGIEDPVGRRIRLGTATSNEPLREVIGVSGDISQRGPGEDAEPQIYAPASQAPAPRLSLVLRLNAGTPIPVDAIRTIVNEVGSGVPVDRIATVDELFADSTAEARFLAFLITTFAFLALALAAIGTYGTASYAVAQRMREMGIRLALGAAASSVLGLVLRNAFRTAAVGIITGTAAALVLTRFLESYVFGITVHDPIAFIVAGCVIGLSAILASLVPALRAARVDPNRVLRTEG